MGDISKNFNSWEFVPPAIENRLDLPNEWFISRFMVDLAQFVRDRFKYPVLINSYKFRNPSKYGTVYTNSGFRLPDCEIGSVLSQHKQKNALDIKIIGIQPEEFREDIRKNFDLYSDVGLTTIEKDTPTWTHCDARMTKSVELFEVSYK